MLFNSYLFVLYFFPAVLIGWFALNHFKRFTLANIYLIGMSLLFYGYYNPKYLLVITISIMVNYYFSLYLSGAAVHKSIPFAHRFDTVSKKKLLLAVGVAANLAVIFYFKYYNFFLTNINTVFKVDFTIKTIVLPLGISFFTFQQISYLVDSYRDTDGGGYDFIEYSLFVVFFPQLIAGPIVLHKEIIPQFRSEEKRKLNFENLSTGLYIFAIGLFKKVMIADTFSRAVTWGFETAETLGSVEAIIVALSYTFQLYFDFSGYCDMAIGIGKMMNIDIPQNFNSPYKATSIVDFWARWHMTLTRFLREYLYFPLGGSKKGKIRTYVNIMIVFLASGIWHGANWTFILWGLLHGVLNCLTRIFKKTWDLLHVVFQWGITFVAVMLLWVLFRANSIHQALYFYKSIFTGEKGISGDLFKCFILPEMSLPIFASVNQIPWFWMAFFILGAVFSVMNCKNSFQLTFKPTIPRAIITVVLMVWSIVSFAGVSEFLYWGF